MTLTNKATGTSLSSLGLRDRRRTNRGWILWLNSATMERIHQLVKTHENEFIETREFEGCPICQPERSNSPTFHTRIGLRTPVNVVNVEPHNAQAQLLAKHTARHQKSGGS